jgi:hypothetical protein
VQDGRPSGLVLYPSEDAVAEGAGFEGQPDAEDGEGEDAVAAVAVEEEADVAGLAQEAGGEAPGADGPCALDLLADVFLVLDGEAGFLEEAAVL